MSMGSHKWSDKDISSPFSDSERVLICIESDLNGFLSTGLIRKSDSLAIAKHFKQDRESIVNHIKHTMNDYKEFLSICGDKHPKKEASEAVYNVLKGILMNEEAEVN